MSNAELTTNSDGGRNPLVLIGGLAVLAIAFAFLVFGGSLFGNDESAEQQAAQEQAQAPAIELPSGGDPLQTGDRPYEFALPDVNGNTARLSQYIGQPLIINFWATWCAPCRIEMPELQAAFEEYQDQGLVILALDQDETGEQAQAYFQELGLTFTPLLDEGTQTARNYGIGRTLPSSIFINPEGEISAIHRGIMTQGQLDGYLAMTIPGLETA